MSEMHGLPLSDYAWTNGLVDHPDWPLLHDLGYCSFYVRDGQCTLRQRQCTRKHRMPSSDILSVVGLQQPPRWYNLSILLRKQLQDEVPSATTSPISRQGPVMDNDHQSIYIPLIDSSMVEICSEDIVIFGNYGMYSQQHLRAKLATRHPNVGVQFVTVNEMRDRIISKLTDDFRNDNFIIDLLQDRHGRLAEAMEEMREGLMGEVSISPSPEPMTPEPAPRKPVALEPVSPKPVSPEPFTPEPFTPEPFPEPFTPEPVTPEPATPDDKDSSTNGLETRQSNPSTSSSSLTAPYDPVRDNSGLRSYQSPAHRSSRKRSLSHSGSESGSDHSQRRKIARINSEEISFGESMVAVREQSILLQDRLLSKDHKS